MWIHAPKVNAPHRFCYVLVIKDLYSRFVRFYPAEAADSFAIPLWYMQFIL
jgi:hypothetical protein